MFSFLKKNKTEIIYAPVIGKSIPLEQVPDKMFAEKLMGDGLGFVYESDTVYAPCDGEIMLIAPTKHAFGIKSKTGAEILVHIGLDTVNLNGEGFEVLVKAGKKVKAHDPIIKINHSFMKERNIDLTTPLVITNMSDYDVTISDPKDVDLTAAVCELKKK